jgi:hypothetical protein
MKLKPLPLALGMNPMWWLHRFSFISKQIYWDEKTSYLRFVAAQRAREYKGEKT